jgi:hypothetical protein
MTDYRDLHGSMAEAGRQATLREWARKTWLREHMRAETLTSEDLTILDERLAQWTADRQRAGSLPSDGELRAKWPALAREFPNNRDAARPIFTVEEQRDVDESRIAFELRDRIDRDQDHGTSLWQLSELYAFFGELGELDARKKITDRFTELYGRSVSDYAREHRGEPSAKAKAEPKGERILPAELGWEKYEPAFRRWAAYNAIQYVAKRDGALSAKEYAEREEYLDRWVADQQRDGKLPIQSEIRGKRVQVSELMLPYQKQVTRQEKGKMRSDGAYWRRVEDFSNEVKDNIDTERRFTRMLNERAVAGAAAYGKSFDRVKRDIEDQFALRYLYSPAEYFEFSLERGDRAQQQHPGRAADRAGNQAHKSRNRKSREADDDRGR